MTIEHTSTIEIDATEGYVTVEGRFEIRNEGAKLYRFDFNGRSLSRVTLCLMIGVSEVRRIEELVYTEWMESER